jgi:hypothetical protein
VYLDDHLYVIGGKDGKGSVINTVERYSIANCNWTVMKPSTFKRYAGCAVAVNNLRKILLFGGRSSY